MAVKIKTSVFWDVTPFSLADVCQYFCRNSCLHPLQPTVMT